MDPAESDPTAFRALDVKPGGSEIVVGTHRCDIWEIVGDAAEPLIQARRKNMNRT